MSGETVNILMKFDVPILKPEFTCYIQEGNAEPCMKFDTRKRACFYRREDYINPEFAIYEEIPLSEISLV